MDKYRVTLDADERAALERLVAVGKGAARRLTHARILLLADTAAGQERPDADIVAALGTSLRTVERVRQRLVTEGLQAALDPRPQPAAARQGQDQGGRRAEVGPTGVQRPAPRAAATGRCNCWPTNWSCSAWSSRSAPRRCGRR